MNTVHRNVVTGPMLPECPSRLHDLHEVALDPRGWVASHVDQAAYDEGPDWVRLFAKVLGEVRLAADDAKQHRDGVAIQFWSDVDVALGSVLVHQAKRLGGGSPEKYACFHQALLWWLHQCRLPEPVIEGAH